MCESKSNRQGQSQSLGLDIDDVSKNACNSTTSTAQTTTTTKHQGDILSNSEPVPPGYSEDQVSVLLQSLDLLTRLAKLDSATYQRTLTSDVADNDLDNAAALQRQLDDLQGKWKLEETSVPCLLDSIHRLHSACAQYQSHADNLAVENDKLHEELRSSAKRVTKLETGIQKLHTKTERLKDKLQSKKEEKQAILKSVRSYVADFQKNDMDGIATQLAAHERIVGNRTRTESQDTFDSVDMAARYQLSDDGSSANSTVSSVSSVPSVITDGGVATIKFAKAPADTEDLVLRYPADRRVGIQFHNMHLMGNASDAVDGEDAKEAKGTGFQALNFRFDSLLGTAKRDEEEKKGESAFFVVGHFGFDDKLNTSRPPVGARLVGVNGQEVDDGFTLKKIRHLIQGYPFTLSFRVIPLTSNEKEEIDKVTKETFVSRSKAATPKTNPPEESERVNQSAVDDDMQGDTIRTGNSRVSNDEK